MEILIVLVILAIGGVMLFGIFGVAGLALIGSGEAKDRERAPRTFDALFNGEPRATYRGTLPFETVIAGAEDRGYSLTHQADERGVKVLMFKLDDPAKVPSRPSVPHTRAIGHDEPADQKPTIMVVLGGGLILCGVILMAFGQDLLVFLGFIGLVAGGTLAVFGFRDRSEIRREMHPRA